MNLGPISLGAPWALWLLAAVAVVVIVDLARRWGSRKERIRGVVVRGAVLATIALALTDPRWQRRKDAAWVIFVVDRSESISDDKLAEAMTRVDALKKGLSTDVRAGLVLADGDATIAVMPGERWTLPSDLRGKHGGTTDLGKAIEQARALIPTGDSGQIVLVSDGRTNAGERRAGVIASHAHGVPLHVVTVAPERSDPAVATVEVEDPLVRPGATVSGRVVVDGGAQPWKGKLVLRVGGKIAQTTEVEIPANTEKTVPFQYSVELSATEGQLPIEAEIVKDEGTPVASNGSTILVGTKPKVLMLANAMHDAELLAAALKAEGMEIDLRTLEQRNYPKEFPPDLDLVILANAPATAFVGSRGMSDDLLDGLSRWVDGGGGLIVLGGPSAFDNGGYGGSPIARVLPVRLDPVDPLIEPAATVAIVMDKSASMGEQVNGKTKLEIAAEAVVASLQMLRPFDSVGVCTVDTEPTWDVPVQPVSEALDLDRKITSLRTGSGGIYIFTGMLAGRKALLDATTPLRHMLLFADTADSEEQSDPHGSKHAHQLADEMKAEGITLSVIGIGEESDSDTAFLRELANHGGGKFYITNDANNLKALFVEETDRLVDSSVKEQDFRPIPTTHHRMTDGVDYASAPALTGYQKLEARKTAEVLLEAPDKDPLMVTWRYGLGQVVVWTSDAGTRWAKNWADWSGFNRHWTQVARFALRTHAGDGTALEVDFSGSSPVARVMRRDASGMTIEGPVKLRLNGPKGPKDLTLTAKEPGLYETKLDVPPAGVQTLQVLDEAGKPIAEQRFVAPTSEEHRHRAPDLDFLQELAAKANGTMDPPSLKAELKPSTTKDHIRLWPFLALLGLILIPLDAALRRPSRVV
ncbi:MAG: VWA domain-containing protein [Polyangiaceae bacterium]